MTNTETNGSELPAARQAAVEQGLATFHEIAAERDALRDEVRHLKSNEAGYKVALEAKDAQMADLESRAHTLTIVRDEAVGRRAELETVLSSVMSVLRAFQIAHEPLVKPRNDADEVATIGGA